MSYTSTPLVGRQLNKNPGYHTQYQSAAARSKLLTDLISTENRFQVFTFTNNSPLKNAIVSAAEKSRAVVLISPESPLSPSPQVHAPWDCGSSNSNNNPTNGKKQYNNNYYYYNCTGPQQSSKISYNYPSTNRNTVGSTLNEGTTVNAAAAATSSTSGEQSPFERGSGFGKSMRKTMHSTITTSQEYYNGLLNDFIELRHSVRMHHSHRLNRANSNLSPLLSTATSTFGGGGKDSTRSQGQPDNKLEQEKGELNAFEQLSRRRHAQVIDFNDNSYEAKLRRTFRPLCSVGNRYELQPFRKLEFNQMKNKSQQQIQLQQQSPLLKKPQELGNTFKERRHKSTSKERKEHIMFTSQSSNHLLSQPKKSSAGFVVRLNKVESEYGIRKQSMPSMSVTPSQPLYAKQNPGEFVSATQRSLESVILSRISSKELARKNTFALMNRD